MLKAKFWGVRGSLPTPLEPSVIEKRLKDVLEGFFDKGFKSKKQIGEYLSQLPIESMGGYGGNTTACEISTKKTSILIDGGSGIKRKGYELMKGPCGKGKGTVHILMTHFHWDHIIGLPFFVPIFIPGNKINLYAVQPELKQTLLTLFKKPNFPIPFEKLGAEIIFHKLKPRIPHEIGDISFTPYQLDHPDPCWGYKFTHKDHSLAYCVDTECKRADRLDLGPDLPLYLNVNTLIFDAQYTLIETLNKVDWGHAAATIGIDISLREGIKKLVIMHYDPSASDESITKTKILTQKYLEYQLKHRKKANKSVENVELIFAQEDMVVTTL